MALRWMVGRFLGFLPLLGFHANRGRKTLVAKEIKGVNVNGSHLPDTAQFS
jgi:hypothetical protein